MIDLESLNNLIEFEKEWKLDMKVSENFKIKSRFSFHKKWNTLDQIILDRENKIKWYDENYDPRQRKELLDAVDILIKYKESWKNIALVSDYDVDWITWSLVLLSQLITCWFKSVYPIIPERHNWYWITKFLVDKAIQEKCELIVTIDNWTWAREAIEYAKEKWLTVIVTDHHLADENTLSSPDVLINYNMWTDQYPISWCWAAYTLWKCLIEELWLSEQERFKQLDKEVLWLVSVSIIADVCPLHWINRKIVKENLKNIRTSWNYALRTLVEEVCWDWFYPEIWFWLAPVINSMWRYNRANEIFNYFARDTKNIELKDKKRKEIIDFNEFRKQEVNKLLDEANVKINIFDHFNLILFDEETVYWLLWLVAWRIASATWKITLIWKKNVYEDWTVHYHWSWRTWWHWIITTVRELKKQYEWLEDIFVAWHDAACWFWIYEKDVEKFKECMNDYLSKQDTNYNEEVDVILPWPDYFTKDEILRSEKILWWQWYESPSFCTRWMIVSWIERIKESKHFRVYLQDREWYDFEFMFFSWESFLEWIREWDKIDVLYTIWINRWWWKEKIQYFAYNIKKSS